MTMHTRPAHTMASIEAEILACLAHLSDRDAAAIGRDMTLAGELGLDSLHQVELELMLEDRFAGAFEIADGEITNATTVAELIDLVQRLLAEAGAR